MEKGERKSDGEKETERVSIVDLAQSNGDNCKTFYFLFCVFCEKTEFGSWDYLKGSGQKNWLLYLKIKRKKMYRKIIYTERYINIYIGYGLEFLYKQNKRNVDVEKKKKTIEIVPVTKKNRMWMATCDKSMSDW